MTSQVFWVLVRNTRKQPNFAVFRCESVATRFEGTRLITGFMSSLGWYWLVVPASVVVLGVVFVLAGLGHLFAGRFGYGVRRLLFGFPIVAVGAAAGLIALNAQNFARLTHESDVAGQREDERRCKQRL
jgi:hypothetical protein